MKARLFVFGFLFTIAACANRTTVPPPQEDVLYQVERFLSQKPDSVLQILDTLDIEILSDKERAHYCLLKVKARDVFFQYDNETDSLLQVTENYFIGNKDKWFEAQTCEALSRIAFKEGKGEQIKLDWLLKAYQSMEQCKKVDKRFLLYSGKDVTEQELIEGYRYKIQMRLGMCYLDNDYFKEGLHYLKPVYQYYADNQNKFLMAGSANMLGNAYLAIKEYDSCKLYFEKGLEAAQKFDQIENIAYYHYSMSMLYVYQFDNQDYEEESEGHQLLQKAVEECHQGLALYKDPMFKFKDGFYCNLSKCYYRLEQYDSCAYYAEKQLDFMNAMRFEIVPNSVNADIFYRLYKSYMALGNKEQALDFSSRYIEMQQTLEKQLKSVEQVKNEYDKKLEMMQLQSEQQLKRYKLYFLLAIVLMTLVLVLWLANRYRKNKEIESMKQAETYRKLQSEFDAASLHAQNVLKERVMAIYHSGEERMMERIMAEFVATYPHAAEKMVATYPALNESERNIVVLSFLGFRMKEEADILNLSQNTVEKYRSNIKKKAGSDPISFLI